MAVKVKLNRASLRLDNKIARQVGRSAPRKAQLARAFAREGMPERWAAETQAALNRLHVVLMAVFKGSQTDIRSPVTSLFGVPVSWQPLNERYAGYKKTQAFWRESGDLLNYVGTALSPLAGNSAVRKTEVKTGKIKRGAKSLRVSVLITPARLPEPLQSLVMYPFLQGRGNDTSGIGNEDIQAYKLLVNQAVRGFLPEVSEAFGSQLLDELRS